MGARFRCLKPYCISTASSAKSTETPSARPLYHNRLQVITYQSGVCLSVGEPPLFVVGFIPTKEAPRRPAPLQIQDSK
jgi:hypothetical protein